jgi:peptide/nickel transport system ATP-binding protein
MSDAPLLQIQSLCVSYPGPGGPIHAVREVDLQLSAGECLGVVGDSGSGKTQLLLSILGLCGPGAHISGAIRYRGQDLTRLPTQALNAIRGRRIGMVFQDPLTALNPYLRVGTQITEVLRQHCGLSSQAAGRRGIELLESLQVSAAAHRMTQYPHELSGGMRQRVTIAMAIAAEPDILLADEPSTALDVTVQAQVLALLRELRDRRRTSIVLVTHDLAVTAQLADRVAVMADGRITARPQHAYSAVLQGPIPRLHARPSGTPEAPALLSVRGLKVAYRTLYQGRAVNLPAVNDVSFELARGEALGVVGESGSGKSSIARALLRLVHAHAGSARFHDQDLLRTRGPQLLALRRYVQLVSQDPVASLDPRMPVSETVAEPMRSFQPQLDATQRLEQVVATLQAVGLDARYLRRYAHEFSGGQAQRIAIARALIASPELIVCDEPLSALDVSMKSQISLLLQQLQRDRHLSLLFISHDLTAVRTLCDRTLVLYLGRVLEVADTATLFVHARHPYTRALISSAPQPDPEQAGAPPPVPIQGEIPSPLSVPSGCVFRSRCPFAIQRCELEDPPLRPVGGSLVACHRAEEMASDSLAAAAADRLPAQYSLKSPR